VPRPSKYPEEFRRDAVALVKSSPARTVADIARELEVTHETLRQWVKAADKQQVQEAAGFGRAEPEELKRLRKENAEMRLEKVIWGARHARHGLAVLAVGRREQGRGVLFVAAGAATGIAFLLGEPLPLLCLLQGEFGGDEVLDPLSRLLTRRGRKPTVRSFKSHGVTAAPCTSHFSRSTVAPAATTSRIAPGVRTRLPRRVSISFLASASPRAGAKPSTTASRGGGTTPFSAQVLTIAS
jgi:transposase